MRLRGCVVCSALSLVGCGLVFDLDPRPDAGEAPDASAGLDAALADAAAPDAAMPDAATRDAATVDAARPDGGPPPDITCAEQTTFREERFVAGGLVDVAARGDRAAVVYHQATDRALVQYLDGALAPTAQHPWDGAVDPTRLAVTERDFAMLQIYMGQVAIVEPAGGATGRMSGRVTAAGLSGVDPPFTRITAILFGPDYTIPGLIELDLSLGSVNIRGVPALGDGTRVTDARIAHSGPRGAYVVAWTDAAGAHVAAFDHTSLAMTGGRADLTPGPAATVPTRPDLSLAVAGARAAIALRTTSGGTPLAVVGIVDATGTVALLDAGAEPGTTAAVASDRAGPLLGVARIVEDQLVFEARPWSALDRAASIVVTAPTEGDLLDLEAEPGGLSFLVARKRFEGGGALTVTRVRCALAAP